jgi:molybdate transport system substrate-binding protein
VPRLPYSEPRPGSSSPNWCRPSWITVKAAGEAVANGEAEIGFTQVSEVLPYAGAEVGGMLPPDIRSFTIFSIGIHSKESMPTEALVKFLTTPAAAAVIKVKRLEPL